MKKIIILNTIILLTIIIYLTGCVPDAPFKFEGSTIPEQLNDGWEIATPEEVGLDPDVLDDIYQEFLSEDQYFNAKSLLIIKNDKLVFEAYCRGIKDQDHYGAIQSVTKSVTSLVFGILRGEGYFDTLDQRLYSILPDKFPSDTIKRAITIRHLLTMCSGIAFDNEDFSVEIMCDKPGDPVKYILNKPLYAAPGEEYYYRDCDPQLLSFAISRMTGRTEEQWAEEKLFEPLGIWDYRWEAVPNNGSSTGAFGLHMKPRDLAKLGKLVKNHGNWEGTQIVDSTWIAASTKKQRDVPDEPEPNGYDYGYYWWIVPRWEAFSAWGHGGNFIFIVPAKDLIIVMTSLPDTDDDVVGTRLPGFEELVTPLLEED